MENGSTPTTRVIGDGQQKEDWKSEMYGDEVREATGVRGDGVRVDPGRRAGRVVHPVQVLGSVPPALGPRGLLHDAADERQRDLGARSAPARSPEVARDYASGPVSNPEFGDSWIDLTTRQSVQLHWIKLEDVPEIWEKLESVGVTTRSSGGDTMRNISGSPVAGKDADEVIDTLPLLERFQEEIRGDDDL